MKKATKRLFLIWAAVLWALFLPACGEEQSVPEHEEGVLIYAALNPVTNELTRSVEKFNKAHEDVRIEIRDYSDEGGIERLHTELVLGQVPDIMEMHYYGKAGPTVGVKDSFRVIPGSYTAPADEYWMPYRQMAQKGYLEDLWPYIENDPELGRDGVLQAPLKAAEVNGGLYILFRDMVIFTLTGRTSVVGDRYSWTLDELMEVLDSMPEGSTVLRYNMTKQDVYFNLLRFSLDRFVDREIGECYFDGQDFRGLVGFLEGFPDEVEYEDPARAEDEIRLNIKYGRQMLEARMVQWPYDIGFSDTLWQERAAFPGYPTADGSSGSFFYPTKDILAMSSVCQNKEAAWDYIRTLITPRCTKQRPLTIELNIPVNLHDYELILFGDKQQQEEAYRRDPKHFSDMFAAPQFNSGAWIPLLHPVTDEDLQRHRDLVNSTTQLYWPDDDLSDIVWETLGPYFAGDRTLDDTIALIENRVGLYLNEQG